MSYFFVVLRFVGAWKIIQLSPSISAPKTRLDLVVNSSPGGRLLNAINLSGHGSETMRFSPRAPTGF